MLKEGLGLLRPLLFAVDPERAHELTLRALESGLYPKPERADDERLAVALWDLRFPNPVGVAAGFDKDARVFPALLALGCGYAEVGTLTPQPQAGNPKPRVFRLIAERAIINRLGFNNGGHAAALGRLRRWSGRGIVGVNIGANKDQPDRAADYVRGIEVFAPVASYITVNISSPNTPGLRDLQAPAQLGALLERIMAARERQSGRKVPIVVKLAPDIAEEDLPAIVSQLIAHSVDGIAVSNTTLTRTGVAGARHAAEPGGLSGRPLFQRATVMLARVYRLTGGRVPLVGIGGIDSGETALAKIEAGASLLQLYTGLVYEGPELIGRIKAHLAAAVAAKGLASLSALTGTKSAEWAERPLEP